MTRSPSAQRWCALLVRTPDTAGWEHRIGGDGLLALAAVATVVGAATGTSLRWAVPVVVLLPWLALWVLPAWAGLGLAAANIAVASGRGELDTLALTVIAGLWLVLVLVWLQNQGWLPWLYALAGAGWLVAAGAAVWEHRDVLTLAEGGLGLGVLGYLWLVSRAHRPAPVDVGWAPSRYAPWTRSPVAARPGKRHLPPRAAIVLAAAVVEGGWLAGWPLAWTVVIGVLLPWVVLAWLASDSSVRRRHWLSWLVISTLVAYLVARSASRDGVSLEPQVASICAALWGLLALGWLHNRRWLPRTLALAAAVWAAIAGVAFWRTPETSTWLSALEIVAVLVALAWLALLVQPTVEQRSIQEVLAPPTRGGRVAMEWPVLPPVIQQSATAPPGAVLAGHQAEEAMYHLLVSSLPQGTWILSHVTLPQFGGDIDLLVIGSEGVFIAEIKYWAGVIVCGADGHAWTRRRDGQIEIVKDPAGQTQSQIRALRAFWEQQDRALCRRTRVWIDGLLVFAHPRCQVQAAASPVPVTSPHEAVAVMRARQPQQPLSHDDQARLVHLVVQVQPPDWDSGVRVGRAEGPP